MDKQTIKQLQNKIIVLLRQKNKPLYALAEDNCSEVARLVGCWILEKMPDAQISIAKGDRVMGEKNKSHDVILVNDNKAIYVIDPTIWQFFKNKRSIIIGKTETVKSTLCTLEKMYKGKWKISEKISKKTAYNKEEWRKIIKKNINETI
jgi:hypothetical protein